MKESNLIEVYKNNKTVEIIESHLLDIIDSLCEKISQLESNSKDGRKSQVETILREQGPISIKNIAQQLGISTKNVSSILTYLRSDSLDICTNKDGLKFIMPS